MCDLINSHSLYTTALFVDHHPNTLIPTYYDLTWCGLFQVNRDRKLIYPT